MDGENGLSSRVGREDGRGEVVLGAADVGRGPTSWLVLGISTVHLNGRLVCGLRPPTPPI